MRRLGLLIGVWSVAAVGCLAPFAEPSAEPATDDALTRAADCLERGDEAGAVPHMRAHLAAHPDALMLRAHLAEILLKQGQPTAARTQFERFIRDAQRSNGPANAHLIHCHARLMAIAEASGDTYAEELQRGIGLVLLVRKWDADPTRKDETTAEQTLARAATALRNAVAERPGDARAELYLSEVYSRLGQPSSARTALRVAKASLPDPAVTPEECERITAGLGPLLDKNR